MPVVFAQVHVRPFQRFDFGRNAAPDQTIQSDHRPHRCIGGEVNHSLKVIGTNVMESLGVRMDGRGNSLERIVGDPFRIDPVFENLATDTNPAADRIHIQVLPVVVAFVSLGCQPIAKRTSVGGGDGFNRPRFAEPLR
nr:hypothetical protein [Rhodopirellula europaea]